MKKRPTLNEHSTPAGLPRVSGAAYPQLTKSEAIQQLQHFLEWPVNRSRYQWRPAESLSAAMPGCIIAATDLGDLGKISFSVREDVAEMSFYYHENTPAGDAFVDFLNAYGQVLEMVISSKSTIGRAMVAMTAHRGRLVGNGDKHGRNIVTTGAAIIPGASPAFDPNTRGEDLILIDRNKLNLVLGHDGLSAEPVAVPNVGASRPQRPKVTEGEVGPAAFREAWFAYKHAAGQDGVIRFTHEELAKVLSLAIGTTRNYYAEWLAQHGKIDDTNMTLT